MERVDVEDIFLDYTPFFGFNMNIEEPFELYKGKIVCDRYIISINRDNKVDDKLLTDLEIILKGNFKRFDFTYSIEREIRTDYEVVLISIRPKIKPIVKDNLSLDQILCLRQRK